MEENSIYSSWQEGELGRYRGSLGLTPRRSWILDLWGTHGGCACSLMVLPPAVSKFPVVVQRTEAAMRCQLKGPYLLVLGQDAIQLREPSSPQVLYTWPYRFLRKFGSDKVRCWVATPPHWSCREEWWVMGTLASQL